MNNGFKDGFSRGFGYHLGKGIVVIGTTLVVYDILSGKAYERIDRIKERILNSKRAHALRVHLEGK